MATKDFYNTGTLLYSVKEDKTWLIYFSKFDEGLKDWIYKMILADSEVLFFLGKDTPITGEYITGKIKEGKIIKNEIK